MGRRADAYDAEVEVDMTPMIDLTFLLIIFFIIVNDLTQQELEDLKLPVAQKAGHDDPPEDRAILNVLEDGSIIYKKKVLYEPGIVVPPGRIDPVRKNRPDYYFRVHDLMALDLVPNMRLNGRMKVDPDNPGLGELPEDPILIRADRNTPFRFIQRIMEVCSRSDIKIWKVQLAASEPDQNK